MAMICWREIAAVLGEHGVTVYVTGRSVAETYTEHDDETATAAEVWPGPTGSSLPAVSAVNMTSPTLMDATSPFPYPIADSEGNLQPFSCRKNQKSTLRITDHGCKMPP